MKRVKAASARTFFRVVGGTRRSQAATMVLRPGQTTGDEDNVHQSSDQWLYVISGKGAATVGRREVRLEQGTLLLIEAGERHSISNPGRSPLVTVNVYAPPEY